MKALFTVPMILLAGASLAQAPAPGKAPGAPPAAVKAQPPASPPAQVPAPPGKPLTENVSPPKNPALKPAQNPAQKPAQKPVPKPAPKPAPKASAWAKPQGVNHLLVSTGDTVQANGQTLKLYGIFAPSFQHRCEHHAAMRSRNGLLALVSHHRITMRRRAGNASRIKLLASGQDVGNLMVAHGLAVHGKQRPRFC